MKPQKREMKYERVPAYDEWITGRIDDIEYDLEHKSTWKGVEKISPAVRLKFILEGCTYPKKTSWMAFNYSEKSNLYKKIITGLVENAKPNMDFDLDALKGLDVKVMYTANGDFDNLAMIRPLKTKVTNVDVVEPSDETEIPF